MNDERLARIFVSSFPGFGSRSLRRIKGGFLTWEKAWLASPDALAKVGVSEKAGLRFVEWRRDFDAAAFLKLLEDEGIAVLFPEDEGYPQLLAVSSDPPEILFVRGTLDDAPAISVVGTRKITAYGEQCTEAIVSGLAARGFLIVSGLALGVDGAVHQTTLGAGGRTIAVLGTGADDASLYPREHVSLAQKMMANGGAVISEFSPGSDSRKEHFPIRNRLIASLSLATLVIEAAIDSGSLITAKLALEENREVLAVPGPIWSAQSAGTNKLIKLGAKVCTCAEDVIEAIALDRPDLVAQTRAALPLDPKEQAILDFLDEPRHIDDIGRLEGMDPVAASSIMAVLELKGLVKPIGGQMWTR